MYVLIKKKGRLIGNKRKNYAFCIIIIIINKIMIIIITLRAYISSKVLFLIRRDVPLGVNNTFL